MPMAEVCVLRRGGRVAAARATLLALADAPATPTPLRLAARNAIEAWPAP